MKVRATVICEKNKHILLVRKRNSKWAFPGGRVKNGEAIVAAAARELQEETGLNTEQLLYILEFDTGKTRHHVFEASVLNASNATAQSEITECIWYPLNALHDLDASDATRSIARSFLRRF